MTLEHFSQANSLSQKSNHLIGSSWSFFISLFVWSLMIPLVAHAAQIYSPCNLALDAKSKPATLTLETEQFLDAARTGKINVISQMLSQGTKVDLKEVRSPNEGRTALHYAAGCGHKDIVKLLLAKGAAVNEHADTGYTPLHVASGRSQRDIAELLVARGADVNAQDLRGTPLHAAAIQGDADMAEFLVRHGGDVKATNSLGETPLHSVSAVIMRTKGHQLIAKLLLSKGADINAVSKSGITPLLNA